MKREPAAIWFSSKTTPVQREDLFHWTSFAAHKRFLEILDQMEAALVKDEFDYTCPSWAYQQAHINGQRQAFKTIKQIINTETQ